MSEYDCINKGRLKLKSDVGIMGKKKKKHKNKDKDKLIVEEIQNEINSNDEKNKTFDVKPTKAEHMFQKMQENVQNKRLQKIASMTHKQRVEEFNKHLDSLTEHFDIPKVSWTK